MTIYTIQINRPDDTEEVWRIDQLAPDHNEVSRGIGKGEGNWKHVGTYENIGLALRHVVTGRKS